MTYQFKDQDQQVTTVTKWNTWHRYIKPDGDIDRWPSAVALLRYRLYQRAVRMQEGAHKLRSAIQTVIYAPLAFWLNVTRPVRRAAAIVRHYVTVTKVSRRYGV